MQYNKKLAAMPSSTGPHMTLEICQPGSSRHPRTAVELYGL